MLQIKKQHPWILWPDSICNTFPENPANKLFDGDHSYTVELSVRLKEIEQDRITLFCILPEFLSVDIEGENSIFSYTTNSETKHITFPSSLFNTDQLVNISLKYVPERYIKLFINNIMVLDIPILGQKISYDPSPHLIFGAGNFPKNNFNLNYSEYDLYEFKIFDEDTLICHHTFEKFIHDKSYDITENCNFIHKL